MKTPKIDYKKEYLLLHEVLLGLRFASKKTVSVGSERDGMFPVYEIALESVWLYLGTLTDFVNDPLKYRMKDWEPRELNNENVATKNINQKRYRLNDVSDAVATMAILALSAATEIYKFSTLVKNKPGQDIQWPSARLGE